MREGSVVLSYRIGTSGQWKIIEEYSALGKLVKLFFKTEIFVCVYLYQSAQSIYMLIFNK